ncbi:MAG: hypothetical protein GX463_09385 [Methanothrix sp.]|jgi:hypothetical protein|nr:hypothetical protein [Methanothrix sp.]HNU38671.1 hypothetical protein [Methanothrix sp.]HPM26722.1 hypothetical protein [Methanothrix sp.]
MEQTLINSSTFRDGQELSALPPERLASYARPGQLSLNKENPECKNEGKVPQNARLF